MPYGEGNPQLEDGFTRIANEILDALARTPLSDYESRCIHFLWRKTYGWQDKSGVAKKEDIIAYSQWADGTATGKRTIRRTLQSLESRHILTKRIIKRPGKNPLTIWGFQKYYVRWNGYKPIQLELGALQPPVRHEVGAEQPLVSEQVGALQPPVRHEVGALVAQSGGATAPRSGGATAPHNRKERNYTKDNIYNIVTPEFIDKITWESYLEMRKRKKAVPTTRAIELIFKELEKLRLAGEDPNEVLNRSIMNNWTGIFPLKNGGKGAEYRRNTKRAPTTADLKASATRPLG